MAIKELHLAHTQGFCAGVVNAIDVVELCIQKYGTPLYVRHDIVHNSSVIRDFELRGVIFVEALVDVPDDNVVVFWTVFRVVFWMGFWGDVGAVLEDF